MRPSDRLAAFVAEALAAGRERDEIAQALTRAGWTGDEIAEALDAWLPAAWPAGDGIPQPVPRPRPLLSAGEALLQALILVALAMTAANVLSLGFALIDRALPATAELPLRAGTRTIRWSVSALIVFFPLYLWLGHRANRALATAPGRRRAPIRKWIGNATLFVAAIVLLSDLLYVIYALLNGDLTARFAAKAALVAVTAGLVLLPLRAEMRDTPAPGTSLRAPAALALLVVPLAILGLVATGGPGKGRIERRDEARIRDLATFSVYANCVAQTHGGTLPETLGIDPDCQWDVRFADPFSNAPYRYKRLSASAYQVCGDFEDAAWVADLAPPDFDTETGCIHASYRP
ncbi:DUF5671 domain-containing protein [Tropicimonas sp. IMCC34043]|uniref:DUF5671 domain-containing protein n=1 Tax=Tropicimonas sp. IMCC34043 TaxID=2248760 RepID=UPI0018E5150E|nr:DUF5671 domain-containing protein [Tropicimonas sp. IMCC34043]